MGLLDKFIRKETQEQLKNLIKDAAEAVSDAIKSDGTQQGEGTYAAPAQQTYQQARQPEQAEVPAYPEPRNVMLKVRHDEPFVPETLVVESGLEHCTPEYFIDVIEKNVAGVQAVKNVPLASITADVPEDSLPVSVLVSRGGQPVLAIMIIEKNRYKRKACVNTMNACEDAGVPAIRFMSEFENRAGYVVARVRAVMK